MARNTQTNIASKNDNDAWKKQVNEAKDYVEIAPKLFLGGKTEKIRQVVVFREDQPRSIMMKPFGGKPGDEKVPGFVIDVTVIESSHPDVDPVGSVRGIIMNDDGTSIGRHIASLSKAHPEGLKDLRVEITTRFYDSQYGKDTKGFNVRDLGRTEPSKLP